MSLAPLKASHNTLQLPNDLIKEVASYLDDETLMKTEFVCKAWKGLLEKHRIPATIRLKYPLQMNQLFRQFRLDIAKLPTLNLIPITEDQITNSIMRCDGNHLGIAFHIKWKDGSDVLSIYKDDEGIWKVFLGRKLQQIVDPNFGLQSGKEVDYEALHQLLNRGDLVFYIEGFTPPSNLEPSSTHVLEETSSHKAAIIAASLFALSIFGTLGGVLYWTSDV